jgi:beta-1,4-mannosyl-glycoprotein beta-1,4-N-acetylglucosaminyltransferase
MPRIYDCFCYFNEDMLLELRLETLWQYVDYFVISEASYTHAGKPRATEFDIRKFEKYASKIRYVRLDKRPDGVNDFWRNENFIRNNIINGLHDAQPDDLIMISDLDEIPKPEAIEKFDAKRYLRGDFCQRYYSYRLNNFWVGDVDSSGNLQPKSNVWHGSKITTYENFINFFSGNASQVRIYKSSGILRGIKRAWFKLFNNQLIQDGGWHFTWVFSIQDIIKKIESTAHQEFNSDDRKDPEMIISLIRSGRDLNKPKARYELQDIDEQFPPYLLANLEKYRNYILRG